MKITSAEIIRNGEKELMDAITGDLDWGSIERIFRDRHHLSIDEEVEYKKGDIIVHGNEIAYRLEFLAKVTLSVLLDREGNYISVTSLSPDGEEESPASTGLEDVLTRYVREEDARNREPASSPAPESEIGQECAGAQERGNGMEPERR